MRPGSARRGQVLGLFAAASIAFGACDVGGTQLSAQNEWDQAVVIRAGAAGSMVIVSIPPRTSGTVLNSWGGPSGTIDVLDSSCRSLASFPFDRSGSTVWIGSDGRVELRDRGAPVADGMTQASGPFESSLCGKALSRGAPATPAIRRD